MGELERQAAIADIDDPAALAFEMYSFGLGANTCSRLLEDGGAFDRARTAIEQRLDQGWKQIGELGLDFSADAD